jgi:hypothetical protein
MTGGSALERGRQAFERQAWGAAYELLGAADEEAPLAAEDLERAGRAAYLTGHEDEWFSLSERAFRERMRLGDPEGAALDGFWLVFGLISRGEWARAGGWIEPARAAIDDGRSWEPRTRAATSPTRPAWPAIRPCSAAAFTARSPSTSSAGRPG